MDSSDPEPPWAILTQQFHLSFLPYTLWLEGLLSDQTSRSGLGPNAGVLQGLIFLP